MNEGSPGLPPDDSLVPEIPELPIPVSPVAAIPEPAMPESVSLEPALVTEKVPAPTRAEENAAPAADPVTAAPQEKPAPTSGSHPGWVALILIALASSCLAVFLTLAILGTVNQGLSYASPADVSALQSQVNTLQTQVDTLEQDLTGLRTRVDALEELAKRTSQLEQMTLNLQDEVYKRVAEAQQLKDKVEGIQTSITDVVAQSKAFQTFMDGLRGLVNKINPGGQNP